MPAMPDDNGLYSNESVIPFPEMGDRLFTWESKSHYNAQLNHRFNEDTLYRYVQGYKEAGDRLEYGFLDTEG